LLVETAHTAWCQEDYAAARACLEEALSLFRHYVDDGSFAITFESFAGLAATEARPERAARLFGAADRLYANPYMHKQDWWPPLQRRLREAGRDVLESEAYAQAREEGWAMTLEQAVEYALSPDTPPRT
jgi:hypothetical protein